MDKKERAKDSRLQKNYHWSLDRVNRLSEKQEHKCAICGRPASDFKHGLNLDHEHFKLSLVRDVRGWLAFVHFQDTKKDFFVYGKTKTLATKIAKQKALPLSVRGLLCPGRHGKAGHGCCNRLLGRVDNIQWLRRAADYLENPPALQVPE